MNMKDRVGRLEAMLPRKVPYGDIYDFLFMAERTIPGPPDVLPEEEILERLGPKETFVNDRRLD